MTTASKNKKFHLPLKHIFLLSKILKTKKIFTMRFLLSFKLVIMNLDTAEAISINIHQCKEKI